MKATVTSLILTFFSISNLYSQGIPYGQEFQVNTYTQDFQMQPAVSGLSNGGFVICWASYGQDGDIFGVFGQVYDALGVKIGPEFQVNTFTLGTQFRPTVAGLINGGFIVCWESQYQDGSVSSIYGQLFDASGNKKTAEFQVNTYTEGQQENPKVAALNDGGFVVCWQSILQDGSLWGVFAQLFNASGLKKGAEFQVNTYSDWVQWNPSITSLTDSGFVICWESGGQFISSYHIFGQRYDWLGNKKGGEFPVSAYTENQQSFPTVTGLSDGGFVVCWGSYKQDGSGWGVFGQRYDSFGVKKDSEFQVNTSTQGDQAGQKIAALSGGRFIVCWTGNCPDGSGNGVFGQVFNTETLKSDHEFLMKKFGYYPTIAGLINGGFVICWEIDNQDSPFSDIFGKRFSAEPLVHQLKNYSLIDPPKDGSINTFHPSFHWQQPSEMMECYPWEITFDLYIDTDSNFPHPQIIKNIQDTTYTIDSLAAGKTYFWKVLAKNLAGDSLWSKQQDWGFFIKQGATLVETGAQNLPTDFELFQNYPNPFNSSTEIRYVLPSRKANYQVQLKVYDILGRLIKVLVDQEQSARSYAISWDGTDLGGNRVASGVYFYSLQSGEFKLYRKMLMLQ